MKQVFYVLGSFLLLTACGKTFPVVESPQKVEQQTQKPAAPSEKPKGNSDAEEPKTTEQKQRELPPDSAALKRLGLTPLDLPKASYPDLPNFDYPDKKGEDEHFKEEVERMRKEFAPNGEGGILSIASTHYTFWGYGVPKALVQTGRTTRKEGHTWYSLQLEHEFLPNASWREIGRYEDKPGVFDSLYRLHNDYKTAEYFTPQTVTPYDLRHLRIESDGVDVSPLFALVYDDFRPSVAARRLNAWVVRTARVSSVSMHELDWLRNGYFRIVALTDKYPAFKVHFVLRDGTVLTQECKAL